MAFIRKQTMEIGSAAVREPEREFSDLIIGLADTDPAIRRWAARDLSSHLEASNELIERLKIEKEVSVREIILTSLIRLGDPVAVNGLVECLRSDDASLRNQAIESLKQLSKEVAPLMRWILADPDPDVRIFAINILESLRHPHVETWLMEVIQEDPHVNVCATALDLLSEIGTDKSAGPIMQLKDRYPDDPYIQFTANLALNRIREG